MGGKAASTSRIMIAPPDSRSLCDVGASMPTTMSSAVGNETGLGAGGFVTDITGKGPVVSEESSIGVCSGPELDEAWLESERTGMGTSAPEVPDNDRSLLSDTC